MTVLDEILAMKRDEVTLLHQPQARDAIRKAALARPPTRGFEVALRERRTTGRLGVIAEIKRRSPSKGDLAPDLDPAAVAKAYEHGGAACLSVLTDGPFFGGSVADLQSAHAATSSTPILRKDFTIDPDQVYEARGIGADALLLIVAALPDEAVLADLLSLARELGLDAVVEAHDERELERAVTAGSTIVGINARDLATFAEDLDRAEALVASLPREVVAVAESAIRSVDDAQRMADAGFDAVLVGEALVRSADPEGLVRQLASLPFSAR